MKLTIALICLTVPIVGNAWELTYSPPRWPGWCWRGFVLGGNGFADGAARAAEAIP